MITRNLKLFKPKEYILFSSFLKKHSNNNLSSNKSPPFISNFIDVNSNLIYKPACNYSVNNSYKQFGN